MPYIKGNRRAALRVLSDRFNHEPIESAGELNYILTLILHTYRQHHTESYQTYNDMIGALESAKLELYRRSVALYEDTKIKENGDVEI